MYRTESSPAECCPPVPTSGFATLDVLLRAGWRESGESGSDAYDRRTVFEDAVLRQPQDCRGPGIQSQADSTADASNGDRSDLPAAADDASGIETQDLPVFTAKCDDYTARPGLEYRHHVRSDVSWFSLSGGRYGLVQPLCAIMAAVEPSMAAFAWRRWTKPSAVASRRFSTPDQGCQFTAVAFTSRLENCGIAISMDGRGRALDNVFIERLWRSVKYEEVYLKDYSTAWEAEISLASYFQFYCQERIHQSLDYRTPAEVYQTGRWSSGVEREKSTRNRAQKIAASITTQSVNKLLRPCETWEGSRGPLSQSPTP